MSGASVGFIFSDQGHAEFKERNVSIKLMKAGVFIKSVMGQTA